MKIKKACINFIIEYILIVFCYMVCGLTRVFVSEQLAARFYISTVIRFLPTILIWAIFNMVIYFIIGDIGTYHIRKGIGELLELFLVQSVSIVLLSIYLFWMKGQEISRFLLIMLWISTIAILYVKRVALYYILKKYSQGKEIRKRAILLCDANVDENRISAIIKSIESKFILVGIEYNTNQIDYSTDTLKEKMSSKIIDEIILMESGYSDKVIRNILVHAGMFGIKVYVIPKVDAYISGRCLVDAIGDIHLIEIAINDTDNILGVNISITNMDKTVKQITENLEEWRGKYICVSNVHTTVMSHDDMAYRDIQNNAVLALPDGGPLSVHSKKNGSENAKRVTGPDLMKVMLAFDGEKKYRHFFYGGTQETLDMLKKVIPERYPNAEIAGMVSPPFRPLTIEEDDEYIRMINETKPDFVWVGLGAPKQEIWMAAHKDKVNAIMIGVGAAFDYEAGNIKRAPKWMQEHSLEWLYRLAQDPFRLIGRYLKTNIKYLWLTRR